MAKQLKLSKVVSSLPTQLEADSVYFVRVGAGFDLYVTNSAGTVVAYSLNTFQLVASFAAAKAAVTAGVPKDFLVTTNELFGAPTRTTYTGSDWYHAPALLQNN